MSIIPWIIKCLDKPDHEGVKKQLPDPMAIPREERRLSLFLKSPAS